MQHAKPTVQFLDLRAAYDELKRETDDAVNRVLASGRFLQGPETEAFEAEFAAYCGARHCVGVGNGLDALHLILRAYGIGPGDEVIVPSNTFIATWLAATFAGADPVPVEPRSDTFNLDPERVEAAITPRTRAVIAVHLYGQCADMTSLTDICRRHDLQLIEDAAQAQGARQQHVRAGLLGDAAGFSFYPGKNLGAYGDAGAVVTDDPDLARRVRMLGNYGSRTKYEHLVAGFNSRIDELQAAMLRVKLRVLDRWNERRRCIALRYSAGLADVSLVRPVVAEGCEPVWHLYVVRTPRRDDLQAFLGNEGIQALIHYPVPPHLQGAYFNSRWRNGSFPISEAMHEQVLSLPISPHISEAAVDAVLAACVRAQASGLLDSL